MKKDLSNIGGYDFQIILQNFLKSRKTRIISEKYINDFRLLCDKHYRNFKPANHHSVSEIDYIDSQIRLKAIKTFKSDFIQFEKGGSYLKHNIEHYSYYQDGKYRATIKSELIEITENDFNLLTYLFK